ncbi:hypothetical protein PROFUN_08783 [Planoprotostelium fungivorum]|uniref:Mif2/CENP-C cupin domain-containing protein n=1 Tax=Planoprotostelium fungivorum TaxID=1890364 RepID=A0A2P6MVR1_9EUKA|nr:hypothetical protein PROFUN_08783 [Planoprotostelium fungivorum]
MPSKGKRQSNGDWKITYQPKKNIAKDDDGLEDVDQFWDADGTVNETRESSIIFGKVPQDVSTPDSPEADQSSVSLDQSADLSTTTNSRKSSKLNHSSLYKTPKNHQGREESSEEETEKSTDKTAHSTKGDKGGYAVKSSDRGASKKSASKTTKKQEESDSDDSTKGSISNSYDTVEPLNGDESRKKIAKRASPSKKTNESAKKNNESTTNESTKKSNGSTKKSNGSTKKSNESTKKSNDSTKSSKKGKVDSPASPIFEAEPGSPNQWESTAYEPVDFGSEAPSIIRGDHHQTVSLDDGIARNLDEDFLSPIIDTKKNSQKKGDSKKSSANTEKSHTNKKSSVDTKKRALEDESSSEEEEELPRKRSKVESNTKKAAPKKIELPKKTQTKTKGKAKEVESSEEEEEEKSTKTSKKEAPKPKKSTESPRIMAPPQSVSKLSKDKKTTKDTHEITDMSFSSEISVLESSMDETFHVEHSIDDPEEAGYSDPEDTTQEGASNTRRESLRRREKPVDFWRNDKLVYKKSPVHLSEDDAFNTRTIVDRVEHEKTPQKSRVSRVRMMEGGKIPQVRASNGKRVPLCVRKLREPKRTDEDYNVTTAGEMLNHDLFISGVINLPPGETYNRDNTDGGLVLMMILGALSVEIEGMEKFHAYSGDHFWLPQDSNATITNIDANYIARFNFVALEACVFTKEIVKGDCRWRENKVTVEREAVENHRVLDYVGCSMVRWRYLQLRGGQIGKSIHINHKATTSTPMTRSAIQKSGSAIMINASRVPPSLMDTAATTNTAAPAVARQGSCFQINGRAASIGNGLDNMVSLKTENKTSQEQQVHRKGT